MPCAGPLEELVSPAPLHPLLGHAHFSYCRNLADSRYFVRLAVPLDGRPVSPPFLPVQRLDYYLWRLLHRVHAWSPDRQRGDHRRPGDGRGRGGWKGDVRVLRARLSGADRRQDCWPYTEGVLSCHYSESECVQHGGTSNDEERVCEVGSNNGRRMRNALDALVRVRLLNKYSYQTR